MKPAQRRYRKKVHRDRERIATEERKARGERSGTESAVDEILDRILPKGHRGRTDA